MRDGRLFLARFNLSRLSPTNAARVKAMMRFAREHPPTGSRH
jgi:hypothetical protein